MKNCWLKRLSLLLLCMAMSFSIASCKDDGDAAETAPETQETTQTPSDTELTEPDYKKIACVTPNGYQNFRAVFGNENTALSIPLPKDWTFIGNNSGGYIIMKNSDSIGTLSTSDSLSDNDTSTVVYTAEDTSSGISTKHTIHRYGSGDDAFFRHRIKISFKVGEASHSLFINVAYEELNEVAITRLIYNCEPLALVSDAQMGCLKLSEDQLESDPTVAILGNSFINSSEIGYILEDMVDGKCAVDAISIGMATVYDTYSQDTAILSDISNGKYDAIFLCGLYRGKDVTALSTVIDACKASDTPLAIFPAHNEDPNDVASAMEMYDYPILINWQEELDQLISSGVSRSELCEDDSYGHSKPLAGYVGAHMIYRALFDELPPELDIYDMLTQSEINSHLGSYVHTGTFELIDTESVYKFY